MASRHEILCINKTNRSSEHERISYIGGLNTDGTRWKVTQEAAIEGIENGTWEFYVHRGGKIVDVIVSTSSLGNKYIKTKNDGAQPDNLLSLGECP
jgi:hypothetical protein